MPGLPTTAPHRFGMTVQSSRLSGRIPHCRPITAARVTNAPMAGKSIGHCIRSTTSPIQGRSLGGNMSAAKAKTGGMSSGKSWGSFHSISPDAWVRSPPEPAEAPSGGSVGDHGWAFARISRIPADPVDSNSLVASHPTVRPTPMMPASLPARMHAGLPHASAPLLCPSHHCRATRLHA